MFSQVIGQSDQPYTNRLAESYGLATKSYAFGHPSLPNYLDIVSGSSQGVTDDNPPSSHAFPGSPTLADQLVAAGYSAHAYAENLPRDPTISAGNYAVRHVPWEYFPHANISVSDASALIPDLNRSGAPDFVWYTPNLIDDEHNGTVEQGDAFLSTFIPEVQSTAWYRASGEIIIEWDESDGDDSGINGSGGGHIPTIVVSDALEERPGARPDPGGHGRHPPLHRGRVRAVVPGRGGRYRQREHRRSARPRRSPSPVTIGARCAPPRSGLQSSQSHAAKLTGSLVVRELSTAWPCGEDQAPP